MHSETTVAPMILIYVPPPIVETVEQVTPSAPVFKECLTDRDCPISGACRKRVCIQKTRRRTDINCP